MHNDPTATPIRPRDHATGDEMTTTTGFDDTTTVPQVEWLWAFLDTPLDSADESWPFWATVTRTTMSPRRGPDDEFATLLPARGGSWIKLQAVGSGGGLHLDLDGRDVHASARHAAALGARQIGHIDDTVIIMQSPGGFTFCLTTWDGTSGQVRTGEVDLLDQVCLDIPSTAWERECRFWADLTGWELRDGSIPSTFRYLVRRDDLPIRVLLQRVGATGPVTGHLDFACTDRGATVAAHVAAGARVVAEHPGWTVMEDPVGRVYCCTDRDPRTGQLA